MKTLLCFVCAFSLCLTVAAETTNRVSAMVKKGEMYQLEPVAPLIDGPDRVTIVEFGPDAWVLVDYEASMLLQGELVPKTRKGQMWINFNHVVAARKLVPGVTESPVVPRP